MDGWTMLDAIKADIRRQKSANACFAPWRPPTDKPWGEYHGVDGTGARRSNAVKGQVIFFEEAIEHAPSEGAVAAPALEGQVERFLLGNRLLELARLGMRGNRLLELARLGMRGHPAPPFRAHARSSPVPIWVGAWARIELSSASSVA
jgi:hypothetical protein